MRHADLPIRLYNRASRIAASMERCHDDECRPTVIRVSRRPSGVAAWFRRHGGSAWQREWRGEVVL